MRWVAAIVGIFAVGLGTVWTFYGFGLLAYRNLICFDVCGLWQSGPENFFVWVGLSVLALGIASISLAVSYQRKD